jgi:Zn finger protein HypA/HybF involved in hydrogenase expression
MFNLTKDTIYRRIKRYHEKERDAMTYYCENCNEEPLHLKGKDRCGKCGNQVIKIPDPAKRVVSNDCAEPEITD